MYRLGDAVGRCLNRAGLDLSRCRFGVVSCGNFDVSGPGVYIFYEGEQIYYVGEANDVKRRLKEHCAAHIGGSEGVVRFFIYLFDNDLCDRLPQNWRNMKAKEREDYIKERILKPFIGQLDIYVAICDELKDLEPRKVNSKRKEIEECLIDELKPTLNPLEPRRRGRSRARR
ncbi:MAG: GIY-YIG nuclease family protein [Thermoproteus sp.]